MTDPLPRATQLSRAPARIATKIRIRYGPPVRRRKPAAARVNLRTIRSRPPTRLVQVRRAKRRAGGISRPTTWPTKCPLRRLTIPTALARPSLPDDRLDPPAADQIAAAVTEIQRVLRDDFSAAKKPAEKTAMAEKLLALVPDSSDASERYALLAEARRLATAANNPALALQAADALAESFAVDRFELLAKTAEDLAERELPTAARKELVEAIEPLVEQALAAGQFAPGRRLAALGLAAARKSNQTDIAKALTRLGKELAAGEKLAASAADARSRLEQNPDDPQANETLGKYLCLYAGDWPAGLPHLARADNAALRAVAELETSADPAPNVAARVGDAWWDLAEQGGADAGRMRARAGYWYQRAVGELTGLTKTRVEKRLEEIATALPNGGVQPVNSAGGVVADKLVLWNCHDNHWQDRGTLSCNVELRKAGKVVWSKPAIALAWSKDAEPATTIPLPKIGFDALRVETVTYQGKSPGLCELEVFQGRTNLARGKPVTASGSHNPGVLATTVVDGVRDSSQIQVGYWVAPDQQNAWIEVQVAQPASSHDKTVYLSDLPAFEVQVHSGTALTTTVAVGGSTSRTACSCIRRTTARRTWRSPSTRNIRRFPESPRSATRLAYAAPHH